MNAKDNAIALTTMEAASDQLAVRLKEPTTSSIPRLPSAPACAPEHAPPPWGVGGAGIGPCAPA
jgi:hypothetical protein